MTLKIFLDDKRFHCLKRSIPPRSHSKLVLENDVHFLGSNAIVSCNETEAGNLLLYAETLPGRRRFNKERVSFCKLGRRPVGVHHGHGYCRLDSTAFRLFLFRIDISHLVARTTKPTP
jgi:hypothetical protein